METIGLNTIVLLHHDPGDNASEGVLQASLREGSPPWVVYNLSNHLAIE